jgi:hypothetical protein
MSDRPTMQGLQFTEEFTTREQWGEAPSDSPDEVPGLRRYWGKYPGVVVNPIDPEGRCRLFVQVPDVFGPNVSSWALPCLPFAGLSMGMYVVPQPGTNVWVEFLHGNPDIPIWTGFWFGSFVTTPKTALLAPPGPPKLIADTLLQHAFVISDVPVMPFLPKGGVLLKSGTGSYVAVDATGVRIFGVSVQVNGLPDGVNPLAAALAIT